MSAYPNPNPRRGEPSGEQLIFAVLAVVLAAVGAFLARLLGDG